MKIEVTVNAILTEREMRLASTNGGLEIALPPLTTKVVVKVEQEAAKS